MFKVVLGQAEGIETDSTVKKVITQCKEKLKELYSVPPDKLLGRTKSAGIILTGIEHDHQAILDELSKNFPQTEIIGCTTAGSFSNSYGFSEDSISLILFHSNSVDFSAGILKDISEIENVKFSKSLQDARQKMKNEESLCLVFTDAYSTQPIDRINEMASLLTDNCPIVGCSAGRSSTVKTKPLQFSGTEVLQDAMPYLLMSGDVKFSFTVSNSWEPVGKKARITESDANEILKIDNEEALSFFQKYLGKNTRPDYEFPLAVFDNETTDKFYIRVPTAYNEEKGSVVLGAAVEKDSYVQLSSASPAKIIEETRKSVQQAVNNFDGIPEAALVFSCNARKGILGTRVVQELETLEEVLGNDIPIWGMYAFSEFAPISRKNTCELHHMTMITLLIGESSNFTDDNTKPSLKTTILKIEDVSAVQDPGLLQRKLNRSENYRVSLEKIKDSNTALLREVNLEIKKAHEKINAKNNELEILNRALKEEKEKSDDLLRNILPDEVAEELKAKGMVEPVFFGDASVLFTDFKGFTKIAAKLTPDELVKELDMYFSEFDSITAKHGLEKLKTIGDAYMCAGGIPKPKKTHVMDMVNAAWEMAEYVEKVKSEVKKRTNAIWDIRIGIHSGPLMAGVVGRRKFAYDIWGDVVNVAARLESTSEPGRINISDNVYKNVKVKYNCEYRGKIEAKNKGKIDMYFVNEKVQ